MSAILNFKEVKIQSSIETLKEWLKKPKKNKLVLNPEVLLPAINLEDLASALQALNKYAERFKKEEECIDLAVRTNSIYCFGDEIACNFEDCGNCWYTKSEPTLTESDIQDRILKLSKLLVSLRQYSLSKLILDYKSIFRCKVPLLFKNLDDAHIANLIPVLPRISFSYKINQHPKKWDLTTYKRHYALHQTY